MKNSQAKSKQQIKQDKAGIFGRISKVFINISNQKFERSQSFEYFCSFLIIISYFQLNLYLYFPTIVKMNTFEKQIFTYNKFHEALLYGGNIQLYLFESLAPNLFDPNYFNDDESSVKQSNSSRILSSDFIFSQEVYQKNISHKKRLLQSQYNQNLFGFYNKNSTSSTSESSENIVSHNNNQTETLSKQLSIQIIILFLLTLILSVIVYRFFEENPLKKHKTQNVKQNKSSLDNLLYHFFHCYNCIILIPLLQIILICSQLSSETRPDEISESAQKVFIQILSIINLIFCILLSLCITLFSEQSLMMESNGLIRLNRTNLYITTNIIKIICTFYFCLIQSRDSSFQNTVKYLQIIFIAFYLIIQLIDITRNFPFTSFKIIETFMTCIIISLTSLVLYIFWNPLNALSDKMHNLLLILTAFLNLKMVQVRKSQFFEKLYTADLSDIKEDKSVKYRIYYKISLLLSEIESLCQDQKQNFIVCGLLQTHIKTCQNKFCYCQNFTSSFEQTNETEKHKQVKVTYSQSFYTAYMYDQLEKFKKVLQLNQSEDQLFFCHYAMALCKMDRYSKSLQQLFYLNDQINKFEYDNNAANINQLVKQSLPILMNFIRNQFILTFQQQVTSEEEDVKICTQNFQKIQQKKDQIKYSLTKAIQNKLVILDKIVKNSYSSNKNFFNDAKKLTCQLDKIQKDIYKFYNEYPSYDQKLILIFFLSEIRNDLYGAQIINKQVCMEDEFFVRVLRNSKINYFSEKVCIFKVGYGSEKGKLNWYSKNAASILMLSEETLKFSSHINDLIPRPIRDHHNQIVQNFLKTGKSKSFRKLSKIYLRDKQNYAQQCIIFFDIDSLQLNDLSLITFIKPIRSYSSTVSLFFDFEGNLLCSTPNLWTNLILKEEIIDFDKSHLHNLSWYGIFPKIDEYITSNQTYERTHNKFFKVKMFLPKESSQNAKSQQSTTSFHVPKLFAESQKNVSTQKQRGFIEFEVSLNVIEQPYQNKQKGRIERYYIFEVDDIKKIKDDSTSGNSTSFTKLDSSFKTNTVDNISINSGAKITNGLETEHNTNEDEAEQMRQQQLQLKKKTKSSEIIESSKNTNQVNNQLQSFPEQISIQQQKCIQNKIIQGIAQINIQSYSDTKQQNLEKSPTFKNQSICDLSKDLSQNQNRDQFSPSKYCNNSTQWTFNNFISSEENIPIREQRAVSSQLQNGSIIIRAKKSSTVSQDIQKNLEVIQEHVDSNSARESDKRDFQNAEESFHYQYYNIPLQKEDAIQDHHGILTDKSYKYFQQDLDFSPLALSPQNKYNLEKKQQDNSNIMNVRQSINKIDITSNEDTTKLYLKHNQDSSNLFNQKNNSESNSYLIKANQELSDLKQFQDLSKQEIKLNFELSNYDYSIKNQKNAYQETDYKELEIISTNKNYGIKDEDKSHQILQNHSFYENLKQIQNQENIKPPNDVQNQQDQNEKINQQNFDDNKSEESIDSNQAQMGRNQITSANYSALNSPSAQLFSPRDINQHILQLSTKSLLNQPSEDTTAISVNNQSYSPFSQNQLINPKNSSFQQMQNVEKIDECITEEDDENETSHKKKNSQKKQDFNQKLFFQSRMKSQYYDKNYKKKKQSKRQKLMENLEVTSTNQPNMDEKEEAANQVKNNYQNSVANTSKFGRYQYLQKYQKLHYFMESKSKPTSLMYFMYLRIIELLASIILISSFSIFIKTLIDNHQSNIQILKYQSEFLGPLDQGFGNIWQGVNYYFQMASKIRNYTSYKERIDFIAANINYTYSNLKSFSEKDESNPVILDFLDSQSYLFQPDGYRNVNTVLQYNRLIVFQITKAFQYINSWNWDKLQDISVYEFDVGFLNANIMKITDLFSNISQKTMDSLENDVSSQNDQILIILIVMMLVFCILSAISTSYYVKYLKLKESLIELFRYIDKAWADNEIERSKKSLQQIENYNNLNFLNGYNFSLEEKDTHLSTMEDKKNSYIKSYRQGNNSKSFKIVQKRFVNKVLILIMYLLFIGGTTSCLIGVYIYNTQYTNNYVNACKTYQKFADSHSLASRLTGLQEYYYSITANWFKYLKSSNITAAIPQYTNLLLQAQNFVSTELQNTQNLGSNSFLNDFSNFIQSLQNTNLCTQILNMEEFNLKLCEYIQSGSMQTGIITTLTKLLNDLNFEQKATMFNITLRNPRYPDGDHLEAGIMCTRILNYASDLLNEDIKLMIDSAWKTMLLMTILFLMFMLVLNISLVLYGYYYFVQDYKYTKRCLLLLPLNTLILENSFNSNLRILYLQNDLMDEQ